MEKIKNINLGSAGEEYVKYYLTNGNRLSKCLLETLDFHQGIVTTHLPEYISLEDAVQFSFGGKMKENIPSPSSLPGLVGRQIFTLHELLEAEISLFLESEKNKLCIIENALARPGDLSLEPLKNTLLVHGEEVYHYLQHDDAQQAVVAKTVSFAYSHRFTGILVSCLSNNEVLSPGRMTLDQMRGFVAGTQKVIVGAYDGEGFVVWEKSSL